MQITFEMSERNGHALDMAKGRKDMKNFVNRLLAEFDAKLVRKSTYEDLLKKERAFHGYELADTIDEAQFLEYFENLKLSKSQLHQDLFVLSELEFKRNGFFVEFGATNGVDLSNTYLMEKRFSWRGILAEPAKIWHDDLLSNRSVAIEKDCVWKSTGDTLLFNQVVDHHHGGELSTIASFSASDIHSDSRKMGEHFEVKTISLIDLLIKHDAPKVIDYLSIDTEGSEFEILNAFNFDSYDIRIITVEHNYSPMREKINCLLVDNGYKRKLAKISRFDDWYVRQ